MSMQIRNIVLWNAKGDRRELTFELGQMNIITGESSTGKSALIDIVDYCMAAGECRVPGVIRRTVAWYGLHLQIGNQELFIARKAPDNGAKTSFVVYFEEGVRLQVPQFSDLRGTGNFEALEELLTRKVGISPNLNIPPEYATRDDLEATIRHALKFCFQPQYEIASRSILFHRQSEPFMAQAIVDTMPYFLGAVREDFLTRQDELRRTRRELKRAERRAAEEQSVGTGGLDRGLAMLAEAQDVGLVGPGTPPTTLADLRQRLQVAQEWRPEAPPVPPGSAIAGLQGEVAQLEEERLKLNDEIRAVGAFAHQLEGFSVEASEQKVRLESIGLVDVEEPASTCPVCRQSVVTEIPSADAVRESLNEIGSRLAAFSGDRPALHEYIEKQRTSLESIENRLRERRQAIAALRANEAVSLSKIDPTAAQAFVAGRIQLYLESLAAIEEKSSDDSMLSTLRDKIRDLETELDEPGVERRVRSILNQISDPMKTWAQKLDLEYKNSPLRLDWKRLTLIADTDDGELPLSQMGSGKNWVGYHLLAHIALHSYFAGKRRPVPRFLFLDQPTQVFYPPEDDAEGKVDKLKDSDKEAVHRMFEWIRDRVAEMSDFQVIITDHADLSDSYFQDAILEKWRGNKKLIPEEWLPSGGPLP